MKIYQTLVLAAPALCTGGLAAAADADAYSLKEVTVTAAGYEQDTAEAPASTTVITQEELLTKPAADLGQAVGDVPGVDISQTKMGNTRISIRGFSPEYTLILTDGRRQNTSDGMIVNGFDPGGFYMPPVGAIERIEVLRGPASVIYGSDAVGGVVNVITKKHVDRFTGTLSLERKQFFEDKWGSQTGASAWLAVPLKQDTATLQLRARYLDREESDILTPAGKYASHSPSSGYTGNFGARLNLTVAPESDVYIDADYSRFQGGSMSTSAFSIKNQRTWEKLNVTLGHTGRYKAGALDTYLQFNELALVKNSSALTAQSNPRGAAMAGTTSGSLSDPLTKSGTVTASAKLVTPLDFGGYGSMDLTTGLMYEYEFYKDRSSTAQGSEIEGKTLDQSTIAAYGEGEWFINDSWTATAGARLHWSDIFGWHAAPRAYLVWRANEHLSFKGGVASGYKTPAVKRLFNGEYYVSSAGSDVRYLGNPNLKPEESWNYEISATLAEEGLGKVTLGLFYTDFRNKLSTESLGYVGNTEYRRDVNLTKVRAQGVEFLAETARFAGFAFRLGYTYTDAEIRSGTPSGWTLGKRPSELPRHSLTTRLDYEHGPFSAYMKTTTKADAAVERTRGAAARDKYKNYTTLDLGASYEIGKHHRLTAALNNVFNTGIEWVQGTDARGNPSAGTWANAYREYIEGRNLWVSYAYTF